MFPFCGSMKSEMLLPWRSAAGESLLEQAEEYLQILEDLLIDLNLLMEPDTILAQEINIFKGTFITFANEALGKAQKGLERINDKITAAKNRILE